LPGWRGSVSLSASNAAPSASVGHNEPRAPRCHGSLCFGFGSYRISGSPIWVAGLSAAPTSDTLAVAAPAAVTPVSFLRFSWPLVTLADLGVIGLEPEGPGVLGKVAELVIRGLAGADLNADLEVDVLGCEVLGDLLTLFRSQRPAVSRHYRTARCGYPSWRFDRVSRSSGTAVTSSPLMRRDAAASCAALMPSTIFRDMQNLSVVNSAERGIRRAGPSRLASRAVTAEGCPRQARR
jgi:hypothetical protein